MAWWSLALLVLAVGVTLTGAATWLLLLRARLSALHPASTPPEYSPSTLAEGLADLAAVRAEWRKVKLELDGYLEAFEDMSESVERKRRRTTAAASSVERAERENAEPVADNVAQLRARARQNGLPV